MLQQVLLLGNGINDVTNNYKWENLMNDIVDYLGVTRPRKTKPFPLFYEEIYLTNLRYKKITEYDLKSFIGEKIRKLKPNEILYRISNMGFSEVMTTNYDYVIESALGLSNIKNCGIVKEKTYSLFRYFQNDKTKVWHLHGDINWPSTILLGYEQYCGQLQHIRNYVVSGTGNAYQNFQSPSLVSLIKKDNVEYNSWVDLFFTKDIHIVGLSLDYVETELWWLITYRARMILEKKLPIKNSLIYYYPTIYEKDSIEKLEMLIANDVNCKPVGIEHDHSYYDQVFDSIEKW